MQLGSIASNTIFPGGSGQEPHIDYPYWDYYNKKHWPFPPKHRGNSPLAHTTTISELSRKHEFRG